MITKRKVSFDAFVNCNYKNKAKTQNNYQVINTYISFWKIYNLNVATAKAKKIMNECVPISQ